mgnify:FL=1
MPVCSDLTSQQRTASGVIIPLNGKVIVDARNAKTNCRKVRKFPDVWNTTTACDHQKQHQIAFENVKWMNLNKQPLKSCTVSYNQPTTLVGWYTNSNVTQLHYQTGRDVILPAMRCAPGKYSNSASGHFHCTQTRPGQMKCVCEK